MIKGFIFDFGGVIGKNERGIYDALSILTGIDTTEVRDLTKKIICDSQVGKIDRVDFLYRINDVLNSDLSSRDISRAIGKLTIDEDMVSLIRLLGGYKRGLLSNYSGVRQDRNCDIDNLFDEIILSNEVELRKPDERIYLLIANRMKLRPDECFYVDDRVENVLAAKKLGMFGFVYREK